MGFYGDQILPRVIDLFMRGGEFARIRARVAAGLSGAVIEIGFGSGRNLPFYPAEVSGVQVVDPAVVGRRLAARRIEGFPAPVEFIGPDAQSLPVADASVDAVLSTWTLCTVTDAARALAEIRRVLRPGGTLRFAEHGLSPEAKVARLQHRLTPIQRRVAGGCHLDRPIADLVTGAGLEMASLRTYYLQGPRSFSYMYEGVAVAP